MTKAAEAAKILVIFIVRTSTCVQNALAVGDVPPRSALVVVSDKAVQEPDAPTGTPASVYLGVRRAHCGPRNVEMRPGRIVDEALQELRRRDRAGMAAPGIFHIGELGIDDLVVGRPQR